MIEQGCYHYVLNGKAQAIAEPWVKARNPQGQLLTHSGRFVDEQQLVLLVSHLTKPADNNGQHRPSLPGSFASEIRWQQAGLADISAHYQFCQQQKRLSIALKSDTGPLSIHEMRPEPFAYFPLLRVFSGQVIQSLALSGPLPTLVPDIHDPANRSALLMPIQNTRSAKQLAAEVIHLAGRQYHTQRYQYLSERYQQQNDAAFWIDSTGLLLKYCWQQNPDSLWQVGLHAHQIMAFLPGVITEDQPPCSRT